MKEMLMHQWQLEAKKKWIKQIKEYFEELQITLTQFKQALSKK